MDVMDRVRELAPEERSFDEQIAAARQALLREIAAEEQRQAAPRPLSTAHRAPRRRAARSRARWAGALVGTAAVIAAGLVVVSNLAPVDPSDPSVPPILVPPAATAAEILEQTAAQSAPLDEGLQPGQYLRIDETQAFLQYSIEDVATGELWPMGNRENAEAAFVTERTTHLYVPADRDDEWVWDLRGEWTVPASFGDRADEAIATWEQLDAGDTPDLWRLPGGRAPDNPESPGATLDERELFDEMPRDPEQLLEWYRDRSGLEGADADRWVVWTLSSSLTTNLAPADLRAAMFRTLALIDGVEIEEREGDVTTFSLTVPGDGWTRTTTFTVDTVQALVTSVTDAAVPDGGSIVPGDVPDERRTVTVAIVDEAP